MKRTPSARCRSCARRSTQTNAEIEKAQREYDLNKAAELQIRQAARSCKQQLEGRRSRQRQAGDESLLRDKVTEDEIARIVSRWTGIPVTKLMEGEREKLLHLERHSASSG